MSSGNLKLVSSHRVPRFFANDDEARKLSWKGVAIDVCQMKYD